MDMFPRAVVTGVMTTEPIARVERPSNVSPKDSLISRLTLDVPPGRLPSERMPEARSHCPVRFRSSHFPGSGHAHPGQPPHDNDRKNRTLPLQPEPHLSRFLVLPARTLALGQQRQFADCPRASRCAHSARGHPERRALPRGAVSLGLPAVQGVGPSVAVVGRPAAERRSVRPQSVARHCRRKLEFRWTSSFREHPTVG
jgi:hypothetical protein